jgi:hypothetical protein
MFTIPSFILCQVANLELHTGNNAYGDTYAAPTIIKCRFEPFIQKVIDTMGNEVICSARMFIDASIDIAPESRINFEDLVFVVVSIQKQYALNVYSHKEVILK